MKYDNRHHIRTDYNHAHYRFARRCEGFRPEKSHKGDIAVGITSGLILLAYLAYCAWEYLK